MAHIKLLRRKIEDRKGRLGKIKALILNEAMDREEAPLARALVMVSNDVSALIIDSIERCQCDECLFAKTNLLEGGEKE